MRCVPMVMPADAFSIVQDQIARVDAKLSFGFVLGFGFMLWSANACTKAIIDALHEKRGFVRLNLISLAFAAGAYGARGATMADTVAAAQST